MRLKIGIGVIFVLLLAATFLMYRLWQEEKKESARLSDNMKSLCTGLEEYKIRDSLNVVENHVLRLNIEELKELRSADAKLIKELNLRPKEVEYITTTKVVTKDSIVFVLKDSCFNYSDKWVDFYANIPDPILNSLFNFNAFFLFRKSCGKTIPCATSFLSRKITSLF